MQNVQNKWNDVALDKYVNDKDSTHLRDTP